VHQGARGSRDHIGPAAILDSHLSHLLLVSGNDQEEYLNLPVVIPVLRRIEETDDTSLWHAFPNGNDREGDLLRIRRKNGWTMDVNNKRYLPVSFVAAGIRSNTPDVPR
jgi:hypothetical protein